jgi:hypothetical protein
MDPQKDKHLSQPSKPVTMTLGEKKVFANVIKLSILRLRSLWWVLNPFMSIFLRDTQRTDI